MCLTWTRYCFESYRYVLSYKMIRTKAVPTKWCAGIGKSLLPVISLSTPCWLIWLRISLGGWCDTRHIVTHILQQSEPALPMWRITLKLGLDGHQVLENSLSVCICSPRISVPGSKHGQGDTKIPNWRPYLKTYRLLGLQNDMGQDSLYKMRCLSIQETLKYQTGDHT